MSDPAKGPGDVFLRLLRPRPTGRFLVRFDRRLEIGQRADILRRACGEGFRACGLPSDGELAGGGASASVLLARHGMAAVASDARHQGASPLQILGAEAGVRSARPEFFLFASRTFEDDAERSWGLAATGAFESPYTGRGIKLAVLDTGFDREHPDFRDRPIVAQSFVEGEDWDDVQGHGTHCAGTAAGDRPSGGGLRYGVAPDVELHVAKVLSDRGAGREADILAGMLWAVEAGCEVVSMSLGRPVREGEEPTPEYEDVAEEALARGCLIVAAAGNDSTRQYGFVAPVSEPANCPSILAVAALDLDLSVARFSNGGVNPAGGAVDLAAPGVSVISAVPVPRRYDKFDGTSMACPHVAGVAALWAESDPSLRGRALWDRLVETARPLAAEASDVGAGLVRAPVDEGVPTA